jgi:hypothetical protein
MWLSRAIFDTSHKISSPTHRFGSRRGSAFSRLLRVCQDRVFAPSNRQEQAMTKAKMTPLRRRMIDDMTMRKMSPSTRIKQAPQGA